MKALVYGIKNSIYEIIYFLISTIATLIIRKLLIENIHIEVVALQQVLHQIITIITLIEFGISNIMVFYLYPALKRNNKKKINNIMNTFKSKYKIIAVIVFIIGLLVIPILPLFINDFKIPINYIFIYLIMLIQNVFILLFSYKKFLLQADQKSYIYLKVMIIYKIIYLIVAYYGIKYTNNSYIYYLILCISEILTYITISKVVDKKYDYLTNENSKKNIYDKEILKHIKSTGISKVFGELSSSIDVFIIGLLSSGYVLGLYSNYLSIFTSIYLIIMKLFGAFKATIAKYMDSKSLDYSKEIFRLFDLCGYSIGLLSSIVFYIAIDFVIIIWIGKEYLIGQYVPLLLSIQLFLYVYRMTLWYTIGIKGMFHVSKISDFTGTTLNLLLSIILYFKLGLPGIIIATIISQIIQYIIEAKYVFKKFNLLNVKMILEKVLLVILYFLLLILINYNLILTIILGLFILIYVIILFRGRCTYVFKNKEIN